MRMFRLPVIFFMLLEKNNIILCEFPFQSSGKSHIDATLTRFETNGEPIIFMGP